MDNKTAEKIFILSSIHCMGITVMCVLSVENRNCLFFSGFTSKATFAYWVEGVEELQVK